MMKNTAWKPFKQALIALGAADCKTIFQISCRMALSSVLVVSMVACGPGDTSNYVTNFGGGDKKDADAGGYGGGSTGDGGGGQGILCSAETKNPQFKSKLFVRDIFELLYNSKTKTVSFDESKLTSDVSEESIKLLVKQLRSFFGPVTEDLEFGSENFWRQFSNGISFIDKDAALHVSQDANSPIALPEGCKIVQIAFWDDQPGHSSDGTLYVDKDRWNQLDQLNKISLLAHEYFFKEARKAGFKNSDFVRGKIGQLFSEKGMDPLFSQWVPSSSDLTKAYLPNNKRGFKYCTGYSTDDPSAKVILYQYQGGNNNPYFVIPYLQSTSVFKSSLLRTEFGIRDVNKRSTDLMYLDGHNFLNSDQHEGIDDSTYVDFQFYNAGLQNDEISSVSTIMSQDNREYFKVWRSFIDFGASRSGKISIEIPHERAKEPSLDGTIRRKENSEILWHAILRKFSDVFVEVNFRRPEITQLNAFLALKKDIADAIREGNIKSDFPLWNKALQEIEGEIKELDFRKKFKLGAFTPDLQRSFPMLLLKNEVDLLDNADQSKIEYLIPKPLALPSPNLIVETSNAKVSFQLSCRDYNGTYAAKKLRENIGAKKAQWEDVKFNVNENVNKSEEPIGEMTAKNYREILKLLNKRAEERFSVSANCASESQGKPCSGSSQLFRLFAYDKYRSVNPQVSVCEVSDHEFSGSMASSNQGYGTVSSFGCLNLKVGDDQFFKVFTFFREAIETSEVYVIPIAPPGSFIKGE